MKAKRALLVTSAYPYGHGETFITAELEHLASCIDIELVPSSYEVGSEPRAVTQDVNLDYADRRWRFLRPLHVLTSFLLAVWQYQWWGDLMRIARCPLKLLNAKELARALYRAKMFETFLAQRVADGAAPVDLVYFYWMVPEILGAVRFRQRARPGLKVICRAHRGDLYDELQPGHYIGLRDGMAASVDRIYCISTHGKAYLQHRYPSAESRLRLARLGVNDPGYLNVQPVDAALAIVSCSFVIPEKRLNLLVEAIRHLAGCHPGLKIKWTHIGDGALLDAVRAQAAERLAGRAEVVFAGYRTQREVMELYRSESFDVIINVSDSEGVPVSLMEASSAGIPMVATDVGGNSELVNAANGILIPADCDIETIAAALFRFHDRSAAAPYRAQARAYWQEHFNAPANYAAFGKELLSLLPPSPQQQSQAVASDRLTESA